MPWQSALLRSFHGCQKCENMAHLSGLQSPQHFNQKGNLDAKYKEWIIQFEIYFVPSGIDQCGENVQCNKFWHVADPAGQKVNTTMQVTDAEADKIPPRKGKFQ